jgi:hypothetical protein
MKVYSDYVIDDSWIKTIEELPELNKNITGIYYTWVIKDNKHVQDINFIDLIYMDTAHEPIPRFYIVTTRPDPYNKMYIYKEYVQISNPYCWKYKD